MASRLRVAPGLWDPLPPPFPGLELHVQRPTRSFANVLREAWALGRTHLGPLQLVFSSTVVTRPNGMAVPLDILSEKVIEPR